MYQILVCDDDHDIVSALEIYLTGEGYGVTGAYSGQEAIDLFQQNQFHLVLMDIMMPGMDGIAATAELRKLSNVPIIFLTAKSEDTDKILGLNMGADDYITKPFNPLEVIARVRSHLRRYTQLGGQISAPHLFTVGPIVLDDGAKHRDGGRRTGEPDAVGVPDPPPAHEPAGTGVLHACRSTSKCGRTWRCGSENTVAVHIRHLREKIEIDPAHPRYLKVVWGLGYKMEQG